MGKTCTAVFLCPAEIRRLALTEPAPQIIVSAVQVGMSSHPDSLHEKRSLSAPCENPLIKFFLRGNLNIDRKRITAFGTAASPKEMNVTV